MKTSTRRKFIAGSSVAMLAAHCASAETQEAATVTGKETLPHLLHHVFFWLKNPASAEDRAALIAGVRSLAAIETVRAIHVGIPASTEEREVVETGYHVSELLCFDDVEGQNVYQAHPLHKKFVEEHSHLWNKVVVYDVIAV